MNSWGPAFPSPASPPSCSSRADSASLSSRTVSSTATVARVRSCSGRNQAAGGDVNSDRIRSGEVGEKGQTVRAGVDGNQVKPRLGVEVADEGLLGRNAGVEHERIWVVEEPAAEAGHHEDVVGLAV